MGTVLWGSAALLSTSCAVGWNHTSDAILEKRFLERQREFEALRSEVQADSLLQTIEPQFAAYGNGVFRSGTDDFSQLERLGLGRKRWEHYQDELRMLGLRGGVMKSEDRIEFRADPGSISNGDSYKGYEYRRTPPPRLLQSLDDYRMSNSDRDPFGGWSVYKHLKGDWYLCLFVNGR